MVKSHRRLVCVVFLVGATTAPSLAQTPAPSAFEVASIKPNNTSPPPNARISLVADRFDAVGVPLRGLISLAYGEAGPPPRTRPSDQIAGGPDWLNTALFDVVAKTGADVPAGPASVGSKLLMLRTLLEDRFKLVVHHESRQASVYALLLARRDGRLGSQLRRSDLDCRALLLARGDSPVPPQAPGERPLCRADTTPGGSMSGGAVTMADFANVLARMTNRPVIDRTGLPGSFDLDLQFSPTGLPGAAPAGPDRSSSDDDRPSLFTALQEQLGLKLESTRTGVDVLVIDRAERPLPD